MTDTDKLEPTQEAQFKCAGCGNYANDVGSTMCQCATSLLVRDADSEQLVKPYLLHREIEAISAQRRDTIAKIRDGLGCTTHSGNGLSYGDAGYAEGLRDLAAMAHVSPQLGGVLRDCASLIDEKDHRIAALTPQGDGEVERLREMALTDDPDWVAAGIPDDAIEAGMQVFRQVDADNENYVAGETTDWDEGMIVAAIFKAVARAALQRDTGGERP